MEGKKSKLIPVFFVIAIIVLFAITYYSKQTVYNDDNILGNSSGNLLNKGLYCEYDGKIYFSNPVDEGKLYVMEGNLSDCKKLSEDTAESINVAGKYIIYARHNQHQEKNNDNVFSISDTGMYRMNKNGTDTKTLFDSVVNVVNLSGNTIYFQRNNDSGFGVYQIDIDKSNEKEVTEEHLSPLAIKDGMLYYTGVSGNHNIYKRDLSSNQNEVLFEGNCAYVTTCGNYLYFLDLNNNHALTRITLDGTAPEVLTELPTSTYNLSPDGMLLYYQVDNGTDNGMYCMNLNNREAVCLKEGNFCNLNTTTEYAFFQEFDGDTTYVAEHKNNRVFKFQPEKKD